MKGVTLTATFLQVATNTADQGAYTFSAQNLGTATSDRSIIVVASARRTAPSATITSITVGGITCTEGVNATSSGNTCAIYHAAVPTGTTGDVVVTWSATVFRMHIALYRVTGGTPIVVDTDVQTSSGSTVYGTVTAPAGGLVVAGAVAQLPGTTHTWTGVTEQYETLGIESQIGASGGFAHPTSTGDVTATADIPSVTVRCLGVVAYRGQADTAILFSDDFNRADGGLGANWGTFSGAPVIATNVWAPGGAGTEGSRTVTAASSPNNWTQATLTALDNSASQGIVARFSSSSETGYLWRYNGGTTQLFRLSGGVATGLGSYAATLTAPVVLRIECKGSSIRGYINGALRVTSIDTGVTTGDRGGIRTFGNTIPRFDDFSFGNL